MDSGIIILLGQVWEAFQNSAFLYYVKLISGVIVVILLIADILLLARRFEDDYKVLVYGASFPVFKKSIYQKRWEEVMLLVKKGGTEAKKAVMECEEILFEMLGKMGLAGSTVNERLANLKPSQLVGLEELLEKRNLAQNIKKNIGYEATDDEIKGAIEAYERVFKGMELIE